MHIREVLWVPMIPTHEADIIRIFSTSSSSELGTDTSTFRHRPHGPIAHQWGGAGRVFQYHHGQSEPRPRPVQKCSRASSPSLPSHSSSSISAPAAHGGGGVFARPTDLPVGRQQICLWDTNQFACGTPTTQWGIVSSIDHLSDTNGHNKRELTDTIMRPLKSHGMWGCIILVVSFLGPKLGMVYGVLRTGNRGGGWSAVLVTLGIGGITFRIHEFTFWRAHGITPRLTLWVPPLAAVSMWW
jgi:hypothetical protein